MKTIDCINVITDRPYITSFITETKLTEEQVSKIQFYSQEMYGPGVRIEKFYPSFVEAIKLLMHIDFESCFNVDTLKSADNTYDIHIHRQPMD